MHSSSESASSSVVPETPPPMRGSGRAWIALAACAGMLVAFYALSWFAVAAESATMDEPLHAAGAYFNAFDRDFRVNPEDPPLWKYWAMIPHHAGELIPDPDVKLWHEVIGEVLYQFPVTTRLLYQIPGNDGSKFIDRSRAMMLLLGVGLGVAISIWAWQSTGPLAAVLACALFAFDPNFLAHAPLVKNDVSLSLVMFCAAWACWSFGKHARWWNLLLLGLACGAGLSVKFSGVLLGPIVGILLLVRAVLPEPWRLWRWELKARVWRIVWAIGSGLVVAGIAVLVVWASYGFRFEPTPTPGVLLNTPRVIERLKGNEFYLLHHRFGSPGEASALPVWAVGRAVLFAQEHRLLPQAWLFGLLFTYHATLVRDAFLLGQHSNTGFWYYFPCAMLFKTPLGTLIALLGTLTIALRRKWKAASGRLFSDRWTLLCLVIPILVYGGSAMSSNLNLGIRHILPVYPFFYVMVAAVSARLHAARPRVVATAAAVLGIGLIVESLAAFPHYISFFNAPSRPFRLELLSDSNLDWGQDLTYLAAWQQQHPATPLYLAYFGAVDPEFYKIRFMSLPGNMVLTRAPRAMLELDLPPGKSDGFPPGVLAVSATILQGTHQLQPIADYYEILRHRQPRAIVGDSIYLYDWPLR